MAISVSLLASLVSVIFLIVVALIERVAEAIVSNFVQSSLVRGAPAPVIAPNDFTPLRLPVSLFKFRRHPGTWLVVVISLLTICAEIATEMGVYQSNTCRPTAERGPVISRERPGNRPTPVEIASHVLMLQRIVFRDQQRISALFAGIPRWINETYCFECQRKEFAPEDLLMNCSVSDGPTLPEGSLDIAIETTNSSVGTRTSYIESVDGNRTVFRGDGDLTRQHGGNSCRTFLLYTRNDSMIGDFSLTYFEYVNNEHCNRLFDRSFDLFHSDRSSLVVERTEGETFTQTINCRDSVLSAGDVQRSLQSYRSVQMENVISSPRNEKARFEKITGEDVVLAVLALKMVDDSAAEGRYWVYTECGVFDYRFVVPVLVCMCATGILALMSMYLRFIAQKYASSRGWETPDLSSIVRRSTQDRVLQEKEAGAARRRGRWAWARAAQTMQVIRDEDDQPVLLMGGDVESNPDSRISSSKS